MSTTNNVELLIITIVVTALFAALIVLLIEATVVVGRIRRLVKKAEDVITSVESAAETIKHMKTASKSRFPLFKFISSIFEAKDE